VSVPEDGDGITRHGIPDRKAPFSNLSNSPFARRQVRLILGKKQQNQQNPERKHAHKSLRLTGHCSVWSSSIENVRVEVTLERETIATQDDPMNANVLTTRVADGIAVITLGNARRIYFDAEMGVASHRGPDRECES
jgi:hypothetical protein